MMSGWRGQRSAPLGDYPCGGYRTEAESLMAKLANYRSGDRAEALGVVMLQAFCAVASIPRQEDFGLADALATLLRRDGRFLYAEDSFLVQFKSRTEKVIVYEGEMFDALLAQDVSVFIGHVNLRRSQIELHSLGPGLAHPNIMQAKGLVAHLGQHPMGLKGDVLHVRLDRPVLKWNTSDLEESSFTTNAYQVLKKHLEVERWNRAHRRTGASIQIQWETNQVPSGEHQTWMKDPNREQEMLAEIAPSIRVLSICAWEHPRLRDPLRVIFSWFRERGVEADPGGVQGMHMDLHRSPEVAHLGSPEVVHC